MCVASVGRRVRWRPTEEPNFTVEFITKVKVEVVVDDEKVDAVISAISASRTGEIGDGKIFVLPVESVVRIRTSESGPSAI